MLALVDVDVAHTYVHSYIRVRRDFMLALIDVAYAHVHSYLQMSAQGLHVAAY